MATGWTQHIILPTKCFSWSLEVKGSRAQRKSSSTEAIDMKITASTPSFFQTVSKTTIFGTLKEIKKILT